MEKLGVDLGGVTIAEFWGNSWMPLSLPWYLRMPSVDGARESIERLAKRRFEETHFVSHCSPIHQSRALKWLAARRFFEIVPQERVHLGGRYDKAGICARVGITHFVDNTPRVLASLEEVVPHRYLFNPKRKQVVRAGKSLDKITTVSSWSELENIL